MAALLTRFAERHAAPDFVLRAAMRGSERGGPPQAGMLDRWAPERQARVGVMPREGTAADIRWFEVQPCYVFHPLNAYDDGDRVVLDVVRHPSVFTTGPSLVPSNRSLDRWTVDLAAGKVIEERLDDTSQEYPRVDERLVGRQHRYGYAVGTLPERRDFRARRDLRDDLPAGGPVRRVRAWSRNRRVRLRTVHPDAAEDDGVAMGFVYNRATDRSDLVLLDGQTLETVATVHLPARVPHGFHGNWVPSAD